MNESRNIISARHFDQVGDGANAAICYNNALLLGESFSVDDLFNAAVVFMQLDDFQYDRNSSVSESLKSR